MILKVHVIIHHYEYYFEKTGRTLRNNNGKFTELCHSSLGRAEELQVLKVVNKLGTPVHQQKALQSMSFFNSKKAGFTPPLRLRKKSFSVSTFSPSSSPSISTP